MRRQRFGLRKYRRFRAVKMCGLAFLARMEAPSGILLRKLMLKYRFEFLGMERICANTLSMNVGAPKALEKCGFILEGREREAVYLNGRKYDRLNYAILKSEYIDQMQEWQNDWL